MGNLGGGYKEGTLSPVFTLVSFFLNGQNPMHYQSVSSATEHTSSVTYVTLNTQYTYLLKSRSDWNIEEKYAL